MLEDILTFKNNCMPEVLGFKFSDARALSASSLCLFLLLISRMQGTAQVSSKEEFTLTTKADIWVKHQHSMLQHLNQGSSSRMFLGND